MYRDIAKIAGILVGSIIGVLVGAWVVYALDCNTQPDFIVSHDQIDTTPGESVGFGLLIYNNDEPGCAARTFCFKGLNEASGVAGRPTPNYVSVFPSWVNPACQVLQPQQEIFAVIAVHTTEATPPFKYNIRIKAYTNVHGISEVHYVNVLDPWGNTCQTE